MASRKAKWVPEDEPEETEEKEMSVIGKAFSNALDRALEDVDIPPYKRPADYTPNPDAPRHAISFALSRGVLVALLDSTHELADIAGAEYYGLMVDGQLTLIGQIVASHIVDETAVRHKMAAAWRTAHNKDVLGGRKWK